MASPELLFHIDNLLDTAAYTGQRPLLWLSGGEAQSLTAASGIIAHLSDRLPPETSGITWVSRAFGEKQLFPPGLWQSLAEHQVSVPVHRTHLLGTQSDIVVYDAHEGFDPDLFCMATGTLAGSGLLLLLAPDTENWVHQPDGDYERMLVYPRGLDEVAGRFIRHVTNRLSRSDIVSIWRVVSDGLTKPLADTLPYSPQPRSAAAVTTYNREQLRVIDAVRDLAIAEGDGNVDPLVITADRGRGKSSALGAAIGTLAGNAAVQSVWVTAPNKDNVKVLFRHLADSLQVRSDTMKKPDFQVPGLQIRYLAPDDILERVQTCPQDCDLLVVDEAAGIPEGLLKTFATHTRRSVFATTIHGYEGTGRGFQIRFQPFLDQHYPHWQLVTLEHSIRWGQADLLETTLNRMFFLDADSASATGAPKDAATLAVEEISQDKLLKDMSLLEQIFALLMYAHYRTSPGDLRDLLDGLNLRIFILVQANRVAGCCLVAMEGPLDSNMVDAIYAGKRRPRGHLLPQTLCQCLGCREPAEQPTARVVRIAILPEWQGRGLGSHLLNAVEAFLTSEDIGFIGSSFGAYPDVIGFWCKNGYKALRLGFTREQSSGAHSLLVMKSLGVSHSAGCLVSDLGEKFSRRFSYLLGNEFRALDPAIVETLVKHLTDQPEVSDPDDFNLDEVNCFVQGARTFEDVRYDLWLMYLAARRKAVRAQWFEQLSGEQQVLLEHLFEHNARLTELKAQGIVAGKRDALNTVRNSFRQLLELMH